ncbi:MAG: class I SAM-dependent DNA methyltransferase [bacterium]|nr:class I SAM-dependent DNA methyltransferase [bacterium]
MALGKEAIFEIEKRLWATADELRANSNLKSSEYSVPVLGLIFLRYADHRFAAAQAEIEGKATGRRKISKTDYQARGVLFLPEAARFSALIALPEAANVGKAVNEAMKAIEAENEELRGVLPANYHQLENRTLATLLKTFNSIASDDTGDTFGRIYEYFLGEFAMTEGQKGGEFFTPTCLDKLIANIIQPYRGRVIDRACGSGGMFVEAARFARLHAKSAKDTVSVYGIERVAETVRLCRMNLAVHGLAGEVRQGNSYYENPFDEVAAFDFVMANPPFNVDKVDKERLKDDKARFPFGMPKTDNANYLWIQLFYSDLNAKGRAGFVMANSASDARASELEIRRQIIEDKAVDVMVAIGPNMFYTVTLPATLWFFDKAKRATKRGDTVLFVDARHIFRQIDRAHRDITPEQIDFIANIVRLYRDENAVTTTGSAELLTKHFPKGTYQDVPGLCKVATIKEIEAQGWSLNAGRYVGVAPGEHVSDEDFKEQIEELNEELEALNAQARELEATIAKNVAEILES